MLFIALLAGILFGFGMVLSGMVNPELVTAFLDVLGDWKPDLAFVMLGALMVFAPSYIFIIKPKTKPIWAAVFSLPVKQYVDKQLIIGSTLFGLGWGLVGICPGPAVASLSYFHIEILFFLTAMFFGFFIGNFILSRHIFQK